MVTTRSKRTTHNQPQEDRQKWEIIFKALKQLLRKQQAQLDSLLQERTFLHQRLQIQHQGWNSDLNLLQDQISQLRRQLELSKLANLVDIAKAELMGGSSKRDAFVYKHKLEYARSELDDFKACFDILSHRCPDQEDIAPDWLYEVLRTKGGKDSSPQVATEKHCKKLEKEVATLKREYEKLSVKHSSEVSSLRAEIKFAWNQYNEKEGNLTTQLQNKNNEVNKANEKIMTLLATLEQLQSSNSEKDQAVSTLSAKLNRLENEAHKKDEMIARCSKELELLKVKRPIGRASLKRCSAEPSPSSSKRKKSGQTNDSPDLGEGSSSAQLEATAATLRTKLDKLEVEANVKDGEIARLSKELNLLKSKTVGNTPVLRRCSSKGTAVPKVEASSAQLVSEKGGKSSKRKQDEVINIEDTPRLFTSQFKIPKLKSQSPHRR